jgi:hypothetical protein
VGIGAKLSEYQGNVPGEAYKAQHVQWMQRIYCLPEHAKCLEHGSIQVHYFLLTAYKACATSGCLHHIWAHCCVLACAADGVGDPNDPAYCKRQHRAAHPYSANTPSVLLLLLLQTVLATPMTQPTPRLRRAAPTPIMQHTLSELLLLLLPLCWFLLLNQNPVPEHD